MENKGLNEELLCPKCNTHTFKAIQFNYRAIFCANEFCEYHKRPICKIETLNPNSNEINLWIPSRLDILDYYKELKSIFPQLKDDFIINEKPLYSLEDKLRYGLPHIEITIEQLTSIIILDLLKEHVFSDGNKRIALLTSLKFLNDNNYEFSIEKKELYDFIMEITIREIGINELMEIVAKKIRPSKVKIDTLVLVEKYYSVLEKLGE